MQTDVTVKVGQLLVTVEPHIVQRNVAYVLTALLPAAATLSSPPPGADTAPALVERAAKSQIERKTTAQAAQGAVRQRLITMRFEGNFAGLSVRLNWRQQSLARLSLRSLGSRFEQYPSSMHASTTLRAIDVQDLSLQTRNAAPVAYPYAVRTQAAQDGQAACLVSVQFDTFHPNEAEFPGYSQQLTVR